MLKQLMWTLAFALPGSALATAAASDTVVRTVRVSYADLDLGRPEGRATLDRRLTAAVQTVCPWSWPVDRWEQADVQACRSAAWAGARRQVKVVMASRQSKPLDMIAAK